MWVAASRRVTSLRPPGSAIGSSIRGPSLMKILTFPRPGTIQPEGEGILPGGGVALLRASEHLKGISLPGLSAVCRV